MGKVTGYTTGVFDMFHIGHLNILKKAKKESDYLIVGVTTDELVEQRKNKRPIIPLEERIEILSHIDVVDEIVIQDSMDKMKAWEQLKFDVVFVGDDWKGTAKWNEVETSFAEVGVKVRYFPYTKNVSSTQLRKIIGNN